MKVFGAILFILLFFVFWSFCFDIVEISQNVKLLETKTEELQSQINLLKTSNHHKVVITGYHPKSRGINSDSDPEKTATMVKPIAGYTLALSKELVDQGWLGQKIYIDGWGIGKATDRMNSKIKGKRIDICLPSNKEAIKFGKKENILAIVLN